MDEAMNEEDVGVKLEPPLVPGPPLECAIHGQAGLARISRDGVDERGA
jgi:hypothetical protein